MSSVSKVYDFAYDNIYGTLYLYIIYSFDGQNYTEIARSTCDHDGAGLAIYGDRALTTAGPHSDDKKNCWKRTETYDFEANKWTDEADYTFAE